MYSIVYVLSTVLVLYFKYKCIYFLYLLTTYQQHARISQESDYGETLPKT